MRIRRQANGLSSSLAISSARALFPCKRAVSETQLCQLNRSPWDVMPFAPQSYLTYPKQYQSEEEEESTMVENGSGREAVDAVARLKESCEIEEERIEEAKEKKEGCGEQKTKRICRKRGGKGWRCPREAKQGHSLCSHHLMQRRSYHYEPCPKSDEEQPAAVGARRRSQRKSYSASSDFYYYSGFGPLWGKKRGGLKEEKGGGGDDETNAGTLTVSSPFHDDLHENEDDDDKQDQEEEEDVDENGIDDDEEDVEYRKRRGRKPMKARSLKSLL